MGNDHWLATLYDTLAPRLYRHALLILADGPRAEDAVQQAFLRLLARGRIDDLASAEAYLRVILRHEAYRMLKTLPTSALDPATALLAPNDPAVESDDEREHLQTALRRLPPEQREVIHLKMYEQLTFARIAELLSIPQNTAASRYRYALENLRHLLPSTRTPS